jgi:hypothetical protein
MFQMLPLNFLLLICPLPLTRCHLLLAIVVQLTAILLATIYGLSIALEPISYRDALCHPEWQLAMAEETAALEHTDT